MKIDDNTTVVDVAFNLSGSLRGLPVILDQLPIGERIGFDDMPTPGQDVEDIGQTWTPDLVDKDIDIITPLSVEGTEILNAQAVAKAPYTTPIHHMEGAISDGEFFIDQMYRGYVPLSSLPAGYNLRGKRLIAYRTGLPMPETGRGALTCEPVDGVNVFGVANTIDEIRITGVYTDSDPEGFYARTISVPYTNNNVIRYIPETDTLFSLSNNGTNPTISRSTDGGVTWSTTVLTELDSTWSCRSVVYVADSNGFEGYVVAANNWPVLSALRLVYANISSPDEWSITSQSAGNAANVFDIKVLNGRLFSLGNRETFGTHIWECIYNADISTWEMFAIERATNGYRLCDIVYAQGRYFTLATSTADSYVFIRSDRPAGSLTGDSAATNHIAITASLLGTTQIGAISVNSGSSQAIFLSTNPTTGNVRRSTFSLTPAGTPGYGSQDLDMQGESGEYHSIQDDGTFWSIAPSGDVLRSTDSVVYDIVGNIFTGTGTTPGQPGRPSLYKQGEILVRAVGTPAIPFKFTVAQAYETVYSRPDWLLTQATVRDDEDCIVASNTLGTSQGGEWGFDYCMVEDEQILSS